MQRGRRRKMIKIDIISGFLGAGKTTLIKKLLKETLGNEQVVLIENEFGEIGIDGGFLKEAGIEIREMNSGCICCSLVGDFDVSLREVMTAYAPERILIEPSGVGKLSDVIKAVENVTTGQVSPSAGAVLNSAVTVVDAAKCRMYLKNFGEFFIDQISWAGTIILSRTDKISEDKLVNCVEMLRKYNQRAVIITTPWESLNGHIIMEHIEKSSDFKNEVLEEVFREREQSDYNRYKGHDHGGCGCQGHHHEEGDCCHGHRHDNDPQNGDCCGHHGDDQDDHHHDYDGHDHDDHDHDGHGHDAHHDNDRHHHADDMFDVFAYETPSGYIREELAGILEQLGDESRYGTVLRAKGMVASGAESWLHFDYVPEEINIRTGSAEVTGKICVIGAGLKADNLKALWRK